MTNTKRIFLTALLVLLMSTLGPGLLHGASPSATRETSSGQAAQDITGTWSGTFQSRQPSFSPFTITVVIGSDPKGYLVGSSSVSSDCLKDGSLQVTVNGSNIVLAGGDDQGDHITFNGTIDKTGTILYLQYVLNGSASARCESDDGTGTMGKR